MNLEVWYPAGDAHAGEDRASGTRDVYRLFPGFPTAAQDAARDAAPRGGRHPLLAFSHGWSGHRRQSTFLCTHLASHGFVVVAVDHTGNTLADLLKPGVRRGGAAAPVREVAENRPRDLAFAVDLVLGGSVPGLGRHVDPERVGALGHSYGGWTALVLAGRDPRVGAVVAIAPAGGTTPLSTDGLLRSRLDDGARRQVPTLLIAGDLDSVLPLRGMREVFDLLPGTKRMIVLEDVDHFHFVDRAEGVHELMRGGSFPPFDRIAHAMRPMAELASEGRVQAAVSALTLAHFAATLNGSREAAEFLAEGVEGVLLRRGIRATVVSARADAST
jgi:predicted dienelactone hydrolase